MRSFVLGFDELGVGSGGTPGEEVEGGRGSGASRLVRVGITREDKLSSRNFDAFLPLSSESAERASTMGNEPEWEKGRKVLMYHEICRLLLAQSLPPHHPKLPQNLTNAFLVDLATRSTLNLFISISTHFPNRASESERGRGVDIPNSLGERTALSHSHVVAHLNTESRGAMRRKVLVTLLVPVVLWHVVQVCSFISPVALPAALSSSTKLKKGRNTYTLVG